ncbi:MAG: TIGR03435 family protein, partial [Steroidobacteraceae bacterium]
EWQKPESQKAMLQAMLQAMFVDRCKIAVHREVKEIAVHSLVVAKGGPKFKETDPTVNHPGGAKLPWGGVLVPSAAGLSFYGASMASFASFLSNAGRPVQDKTGLTGM